MRIYRKCCLQTKNEKKLNFTMNLTIIKIQKENIQL